MGVILCIIAASIAGSMGVVPVTIGIIAIYGAWKLFAWWAER